MSELPEHTTQSDQLAAALRELDPDAPRPFGDGANAAAVYLHDLRAHVDEAGTPLATLPQYLGSCMPALEDDGREYFVEFLAAVERELGRLIAESIRSQEGEIAQSLGELDPEARGAVVSWIRQMVESHQRDDAAGATV